jgi:hypothetical protein
MINLVNKQLINFYKSTTIFKFLLFKNKYIIVSLILLGFITFLFNKYLNYFKDLTIIIKSITFFLISLYLIYIKFNILLRIIFLIKGIKFFSKEIKLNLIEEIKTICLYFYIFNLFLMSISILFITNLINNIFTINSELAQLIDYSTSIFSLIFLFFYFNRIITNKFIINTNRINLLTVLFNIFIIFTPFIFLKIYSDRIINFLTKKIFKNFIIHCDSKGEIKFNSRLLRKERNNIITTNNINTTNSNNIINNNHNSNINTDIKSTSKLSDSSSGSRINKDNFPTDSNQLTPSLIIINNKIEL